MVVVAPVWRDIPTDTQQCYFDDRKFTYTTFPPAPNTAKVKTKLIRAEPPSIHNFGATLWIGQNGTGATRPRTRPQATQAYQDDGRYMYFAKPPHPTAYTVSVMLYEWTSHRKEGHTCVFCPRSIWPDQTFVP